MEYKTFFSELEMFGIKLGLEQTRKLFDLLGCPDKKLRFIHISGTNGKGSVAAMLASALTSAGFKTGLYTSPHLVSIRERFRIDGKAIPETELEKLVAKIKPAVETMKANDASPTYFECTTAVAATYFAEQNVDFVVWETGMGGRFDATNIVKPIVSIITGIALDHTKHLGNELSDITKEKAGIIKDNIPVFCGNLPEEAKKIIEEKAESTNSELHFTVINNGNYLYGNRKLASNVLEYLSETFDFSFKKATEGFDLVRWPGRYHVMPDETVIDGAHNPQAAKMLVSFLAEKFPRRRYAILFASFADKDIENVLKTLKPVAKKFIFTEVKTTRKAFSIEKLEAISKKMFPEIPVINVKIPKKGLMVSKDEHLLVTGSLYLVGELLKELMPEANILDIY